MQTKRRTWITMFLAAVFAGVGGLAWAELVSGQATAIPHPLLTVTGSGTVEVAPDTARVTASIVTEGKTVEEARERNAKIVEAALHAVKALNLAGLSTKTLSYTLERVSQNAFVNVKADLAELNLPWNLSGSSMQQPDFRISVPVTLGYQASNSLTVRMRGTRQDLSAGSGRIIDALMRAGVNRIESVRYALETDEGAATRDALAKAVRQAQATAQAVAGAAGRKITGIKSIAPSYYQPQPEMTQAAFSRAAMAPGATPTAVTAGMLTIAATVQIVYELDYNPGDTEVVKAP